MKKVLALLLALIAVFVLAACSKTGNDKTNDGKENTDNVTHSENKENSDINSDSDKEEDQTHAELTVEALNAMKALPESDFECVDTDGGVCINGYSGDSDILVIPESIGGKEVVMIGESAFAFNDVIRGVKIPDNVKIIEKEAFNSCGNMKLLVLGKSVRTLGRGAFMGCVALETVKLNDELEELDELSFAGASFEEIEIPNSVTKIHKNAFIENSKYKIVFIGEKGSTIEKYIEEYGQEKNFVFRAK